MKRKSSLQEKLECQEDHDQQRLDLKINLDAEFTLERIRQYISLWIKLSEITLHDDIEYEITWNLTENGLYSSTSTYRAQFFGPKSSPIASSAWKFWAPPKNKFFM
jgi:hypothetical protein